MDTDTLRRDLDAYHVADRFTSLMIFSSDYDFPEFAATHDIHYKAVIGLYQGIIEESYVVHHKDALQIVVAGLLKGQDAILTLTPQEAVFNGQRQAWLVALDDGNPVGAEFIGYWRTVKTREALQSDAWTCFPEANEWYVVKMAETL